jgi:CBS domain-containing protein
MTRHPALVSGGATVETARRLMRHLTTRHLVVVDARGRALGVVGEQDVQLPAQTPISEAMVRDVPAVPAQAVLVEVARLMCERSVSAVPIVDEDGCAVGILRYLDVLRALDAERHDGVVDLIDRG